MSRREIRSRRDFLLRSSTMGVTGCLALMPHSLVWGQRDDFDGTYTRRIEQAVQTGINYLITRQNSDGSFRSSRWGRNVAVCGLVGLSMLSRGIRSGHGDLGRCIRSIGQYVLSACQDSGFISIEGTSSHGPMYEHGFATLFLAELYGADKSLDIRDRLSKAIELIVRTQNGQGGWRYEPRPIEADLSVTVCQIMALRAARNAGIYVPNETIDKALDYVRRSQNPDGGYMYQLSGSESRFALTAAAIVALNSAGVYEGQDIDQAFAFLDANFDNNLTLQRNTYFYYAHYYSVQAYWIRGGDAWKNWYGQVKELVLKMQNDDGSWFDHSGPEYGTAMACLILNMPRTVLPIFQR
jgi:prenyltransferase beta subunit